MFTRCQLSIAQRRSQSCVKVLCPSGSARSSNAAALGSNPVAAAFSIFQIYALPTSNRQICPPCCTIELLRLCNNFDCASCPAKDAPLRRCATLPKNTPPHLRSHTARQIWPPCCTIDLLRLRNNFYCTLYPAQSAPTFTRCQTKIVPSSASNPRPPALSSTP